MEFTLEDLPYAYDALEPYIDAKTMEIHHTKHHQAYITNLNNAIHERATLVDFSVNQLVSNLDDIPEDIRTVVRNHGGGHANHSFFWSILKKGTEPGGPVLEAINERFNHYDAFVDAFTKAAMTRFGSGWAWLVVAGGKLEVMSTANQDSPLSEGKIPLIGIDVWEHAYYLKYQSARADYVKAFFNVIDWERVNELYLTEDKK